MLSVAKCEADVETKLLYKARMLETGHSSFLRKHKRCATGSEIVNIIVENLEGRTRGDAVSLAQQMVNDGKLVRVVSGSGGSDFRDCSRSFFRATDDITLSSCNGEVAMAEVEAAAQRILTNASYLERDKTFRLRKYKKVIVGSELVDFVVSNMPGTSRGDARLVGQHLMDTGRLAHVAEQHVFKDEYLFYRLTGGSGYESFCGAALYNQVHDSATAALNDTHDRLPLVSNKCGEKPQVVAVAIANAAYALIRHYQRQCGGMSTLKDFVNHDASAQKLMLYLRDRSAGLRFCDLGELLRNGDRYEELAVFWINVYNALIVHAFAVIGSPSSGIDRIKIHRRSRYRVASFTVSLFEIEHMLLRAESSRPSTGWLSSLLFLRKNFAPGDPRSRFALQKPLDKRAVFLLCSLSKGGPLMSKPVRASTLAQAPAGSLPLEESLQRAATQYLRRTVKFEHRINPFLSNPEKLHGLSAHPKDVFIKLPPYVSWYAQDWGEDDQGIAQAVCRILYDDGERRRRLINHGALYHSAPSQSTVSAPSISSESAALHQLSATGSACTSLKPKPKHATGVWDYCIQRIMDGHPCGVELTVSHDWTPAFCITTSRQKPAQPRKRPLSINLKKTTETAAKRPSKCPSSSFSAPSRAVSADETLCDCNPSKRVEAPFMPHLDSLPVAYFL